MRTRISKRTIKKWSDFGFQVLFWKDFDFSMLEHVIIRKRSGKSEKTYADLIIMADTETSKKPLPEDAEQRNHVCAWSIAFRAFHQNLFVLWGKKPSDFAKMLAKCREVIKADEIYLYFHNLTYDWVFLRKFLMAEFGKPESQLNVKPLYPISIKFENGLHIKDSLILAQRGIQKWGEDMGAEHKKAVGKWDYNLIRHQETWDPNQDELEYMCCDVLCGVECIDATITMLGKTIASVPLTATGIVRGEARLIGKKNRAHDWATRLLPLTYEEQVIFEAVYHGGYTHGNRFTKGIVFPGIYDMVSLFPKCKDFSSSYPFVLLSEKYPAERFWKPKRDYFPKSYVLDNWQDFAMVFKIKCWGVSLKNKRSPMPAIGFSKCLVSVNAQNDNGRVLSADYLETYVTEIDFLTIDDQYEFEKMEICEMQCAIKDWLPKWFTDYVYERYKSKTSLKGVDPVLYNIEKAKVNSVYGMTAQRPVKEVIEEIYEKEIRDGEELQNGQYVNNKDFDFEKAYQKYLNNHNTFLPYCIGIWVTSYAQRNLFTLGSCIPKNEIWLYSDTDSVYATAFDEEKVEAYNKECKRKLTERGYGAVLHQGKEYWLGVAEDDGQCQQFVQLHAKCYCKRPLVAFGDNFVMGDHLKITVAGVPKKGYKSLGEDVRNFKTGFLFDGETSGKLQHYHYFVDEAYVDEWGNETGDSINLTPCDYIIKNQEEVDFDELLDEEVEIIDYEQNGDE